MARIGLIKPFILFAKKLSIRGSYYLPDETFSDPQKLLLEQQTITANKQKVNIFTGCGNNISDPLVLPAVMLLLNKMGLAIEKIDSEHCCGALFQRSGDSDKLNKCNNTLQQQYADSTLPLLSLTSTCTAQLQDGLNHCHDICSYIVDYQYEHFKSLQFAPLPQKVLVHSACSLRNQLKEQDKPLKLLSNVPKMELINLLNSGCCGAAGNYMLENPNMADQIVQPYLEAIMQTGVHLLLTTNIGCGLHIRAELEKLGYNMVVKHPISFLSEQLTK